MRMRSATRSSATSVFRTVLRCGRTCEQNLEKGWQRVPRNEERVAPGLRENVSSDSGIQTSSPTPARSVRFHLLDIEITGGLGEQVVALGKLIPICHGARA